MKSFLPTLLICMTTVAHGAQSAPARPAPTTLATDSISNPMDVPGTVSLDLYQNGFGFVRDGRRLAVGKGQATLSLAGLPNGLEVNSLRATGTARTSVLGMAWQPAPTSRSALLDRWVGSRVMLAPRAGVAASERTGTLIGVTGDAPVVRTTAGIELGGPDAPWRLVLPAADAGRVRARLALTLDHAGGEPASLTLSYLTGGLSWQADYRLKIAGDQASLSGYASLHNDTGVDFAHARVTLVAGDVRKEESGGTPRAFQLQRTNKVVAGAPEPIGSWHAYPIAQTTDLPTGAVRRIPLSRRGAVPVRRRFRAEGVGTRRRFGAGVPEAQPEPVTVRFEVDTSGKDAMPLPGGVVRVIETDAVGRRRFAGSDRIPHTPAGEPISVEVGTAFDVTASRLRTDFQRLDDHRFETAWEIRLHNAGERPADVEVIERMSGDWTLTGDGEGWERRDADTLARRVTLAAGERRSVRYRVRVTR